MLENIGIMDHPFGTYAKFSKKTNISYLYSQKKYYNAWRKLLFLNVVLLEKTNELVYSRFRFLIKLMMKA